MPEEKNYCKNCPKYEKCKLLDYYDARCEKLYYNIKEIVII